MKRTLDLALALIVTVIFFPFLFIIAILVWVKMGTPLLFKQQRPGLHGKPFYLYKFRTMLDVKDEYGNTLSDEHRLTPFGKFLRKWSLDEIPQLINVIKGELSLVGPRPLLMEYLTLYTIEQAKRHNVRPGITGWAQINGRNNLSWEDKFKLDIWYVENRNIWLDIKILFVTFQKVLKAEGINQKGKATVEKFTSNKIIEGGRERNLS